MNERAIQGLTPPELVAGANAGHGYMLALQSVASARLTGLLLIEAKGRVKHGEWLGFVEQNYEFDRRIAQNYMRLARASQLTR